MKKKRVITYIIVMLVMICTSVYATGSGDVIFDISTEKYEPGSEFQVTLSLKDFQIEKGVKKFESDIKIDKNIIEALTVNSIVSDYGKVIVNEYNVLNVIDSTEISSDENGILFVSNLESGESDYRVIINLSKELNGNSDLLTLKFKIKNNVIVGNTYNNVIVFKSLKINNEVLDIEDKTIDFTIANSDEQLNNEKDISKEIINDDKKGINSSNEVSDYFEIISSNDSTNKVLSLQEQQALDPTVAKVPLPNTGYKFLIIPLAIFISAGLIFYSKYKKVR